MRLILFASLILLSTLAANAQINPQAEQIVVSSDSSVQQKWTSHFGYSFLVPNKARFNKLLSRLDVTGGTETAVFSLPGGAGAITIRSFTEGRMIPSGYRLLDSVHIADKDSTGRNGIIHQRQYILDSMAVQIDVLLTAKGETEYAAVLPAIRDGFTPPVGAIRTVAAWRYGRPASEYEHGKPPGSDDSR